MEGPLVSICIPTYNGEKFMYETLSSIKQQTYQNIEVIISDDNSHDSSLQIIGELRQSADFPVHIYHHNPIGIGANWNNCVKKSSGRYIKFLFQDDVLYPTCISEMVELAETDEDIGLVFSNRDIISDEKQTEQFRKQFGSLFKYWNSLKQINCGKELLKQKNFLKEPYNKIGEPSIVLLRRSCFDRVGFFTEELKQSLDYEYWYRLMGYYKVGFINKTLSAFRLHSQQATNVNASGKSGISEKLAYFKLIQKNIVGYLSIKNQFKLHYLIFKFRILEVVKDR